MRNVNLDSAQRSLFEYWRLRSGRNPYPARKDIRPEDIPGVLRHLGQIDVVRRGNDLRFKYRTVSNQMRFIFGADYGGKWLHQSKHGTYQAYLHNLYSESATQARPVYARSSFAYQGDRHLDVKRLILPLSDNGGDIDMLLFSNLFSSDDHDFGFRPYLAEDIIDFVESVREAA